MYSVMVCVCQNSTGKELGGASDVPRMMSTPEPEPVEVDEPIIEEESEEEEEEVRELQRESLLEWQSGEMLLKIELNNRAQCKNASILYESCTKEALLVLLPNRIKSHTYTAYVRQDIE